VVTIKEVVPPTQGDGVYREQNVFSFFFFLFLSFSFPLLFCMERGYFSQHETVYSLRLHHAKDAEKMRLNLVQFRPHFKHSTGLLCQ